MKYTEAALLAEAAKKVIVFQTEKFSINYRTLKLVKNLQKTSRKCYFQQGQMYLDEVIIPS